MSALDDFVSNSITNYLQSVVFVDDRIYHRDNRPTDVVSEIQISGPLRTMFSSHGANVSHNDSADIDNSTTSNHSDEDVRTEAEYHPRQLMESFAQKGIICALYEPKEGFETTPTSEIFRLCERADVIILDWDLYNDGGDSVSDLLIGLVKKGESETPHHVRFCAIYTSEQSLHSVLNRLFEKLTNRDCRVDVAEGRLHLIVGATRISIFGKPAPISRVEDEANYEVREEELAERIIAELTDLHRGIMPAFALHGLAAIRRNTKRILDKFTTELDGAFLLHRALALKDREAFDELPELLGDELRAVIEDSWPNSVPVAGVVESAVRDLQLDLSSYRWTTTTGQNFDIEPTFREMLINGHKALYDRRRECGQLKDLDEDGFRGINPLLLRNFEKILTNGPELLAALYCNRTQYESDKRRLHFGTIIRHKSEGHSTWAYSVCLMPICDSQRLQTTLIQRFPFWHLKDNVKEALPQRRYGITIRDKGETRSLAAGGKLRNMLWTTTFTPDSSGWVIATRNDDGVYKFPTQEGIEVEWVAELKPLHAQRIAAHMGTEVSRVGLSESEWLRLFCDR